MLTDGTHKGRVLTKIMRQDQCNHDSWNLKGIWDTLLSVFKDQGSTYSSTNESFPSLLGTQLYQWSFSKGESKHVSHDIIYYDHHDRHDEPNKPLKHILWIKIVGFVGSRNCGEKRYTPELLDRTVSQRSEGPHESKQREKIASCSIFSPKTTRTKQSPWRTW